MLQVADEIYGMGHFILQDGTEVKDWAFEPVAFWRQFFTALFFGHSMSAQVAIDSYVQSLDDPNS